MNAPFHNRTFRTLFVGRVVTNAGDSLYYVAAMWLVYVLTGDALYTSIALFLTMAPAALQAFVGPFVDRWDLRRLLVATQAIQGVLVAVLAVLALTEMLTVWIVFVVMPLLSLLNQFVYPAQSAALPRIVEQDELVGANAAFSLAYQGIDAVLTGLSGVLIVLVGADTLFLVDAVTFGVAVALFATLRIPKAAQATDQSNDETLAGESTPAVAAGDPSPAVADGGAAPSVFESYKRDLGAGVRFLRGTFLASMLVGTVLVNFALGGMMGVLPAYADSVPGAVFEGASSFGILLASLSVGLLLGALLAGSLADRPLGRTLVVGFACSGVATLAAVLVDWLPATAVLLALSAIPIGASNVVISSVVQAATPQDVLGRVSATLGSLSAVMFPVGSLVGGVVATVASPSVAVLFAGVGLVGLGLYIFAVPTLRHLPRADAIETLAA